MTWKQLDGASFYRYQLATDEKFNQVIIDSRAHRIPEISMGTE
jgi:hypothetical protein